MSQESVKSFFDFARESEDIRNQFQNGVSHEGIVSIASKKGYDFNEQELREHLEKDTSLEVTSREDLTEQELESVAGGCPCVIAYIAIGFLLAKL